MAIAQTRFYILHHEAAHRLLFSNRRLNDIIGINILGWIPFGTGTHAYRRGHSNHHRDEFGPNEPDFLLYSFYPITRSSFRRKMRRDATGVSAYRMLKPLLIGWITRRRRQPSVVEFWLPFGMAILFMKGPGERYWLTYAPFLFLYMLVAADRISESIPRLAWFSRAVPWALLFCGVAARCGLFSLLVFHHVDAHLIELGHGVLDLLGGELVLGQRGVELVIGDVAPLLPLGQHLLDGGPQGIDDRTLRGGFLLIILGLNRLLLLLRCHLGRH